MAELSLKFTNRNRRLCLCATVVGTTTRHYRIINELENPDFTTWDKVSQRFVSRRRLDRKNNQILDGLLKHYEALQQEHDFSNGSELFGFQYNNSEGAREKCPKPIIAQECSIEAPHLKQSPKCRTLAADSTVITLGAWIAKIIEDIKNPTRLKPSAAYQAYLTLLHRLEEEGKLINMPVCELCDESFVQLIKWISKRKGKNGRGNNYVGIMRTFAATINRARKARLTTYHPDYPYMDYAPVRKVTDKAKEFLANGGSVHSISLDLYQQFLDMDLSKVKVAGGAKMEYYKQMYRDFCILLYEMKSRPIDILRLHWDNIALDNVTGRYTCTYIPAKKKNYGASSAHTSNALVIQFLSPKAVEIVMKYKGKSKAGYVFPFALNDTRWNFDDPMQFHYHYYKGNHICGRINKFLHKIGKILNLPFQLTLYAFRRSAITHAIIDNKMPLAMIAKTAGTSIEMLEKHYANYLHALAAY